MAFDCYFTSISNKPSFFPSSKPFNIPSYYYYYYYYNHNKCQWCNGYRRRKWTWRHKFISWTRLIAFHKALIPLGKVWIQLFSLQLWVNSKTDRVLQPWWGNSSRRRKTEFKPVKLRLKIDLVLYPARAEGLVNRIIIIIIFNNFSGISSSVHQLFFHSFIFLFHGCYVLWKLV